MATAAEGPPRRVMIGTPCYDGRVDIWYTHSLLRTAEMAATQNIQILPLWVSFDALVQRARNDTVYSALDADVDDLVWIDSDIEWEPRDFFKLLNYDVDVVGGTYPKKSDKEEYVVRQMRRRPPDPKTGLLEVDGLGTGFVRMNRKSLRYLWDNSASYVDPKDMRERRMICEVIISNNGLMSEDIYMFEKLQQAGFKIWLDPNITCNHSGPKKWKGNFSQWYRRLPTKQL